MKLFTLSLATLFSISAFAIENSKLSPRHQAAIKNAISNQCSFRLASFKELITESTPIRVDQGILDYEYVTTLIATDRIDQGIRDHYKVTVYSNYYDSYDHEAKDWGIYQVESVKCEFID